MSLLYFSMEVLSETSTGSYDFDNASNIFPGMLASNQKFGRHEFISSSPGTAIPTLIILVVATVIGTFGNIVTLILVCTRRVIRNVEKVFIVNLAISDMYVTSFADPMSFIAKIEGKQFFDMAPGLCQAIASLCTISCVTSLMTIGLMSVNRLFCVCYHAKYERIFTKCSCICMCIGVYFVGGFLVLLNAAGIGDHGYDHKSIECIWDRMATYPYTIVFSIALVWIPSLTIGICYTKIYLYVRAHKKRMNEQYPQGGSAVVKSIGLAKTLFIIYAVFVTCWAPYALIIVADSNDTWPHQLHVYITMFAHLHPSATWIIYYFTNKRYAKGFRKLFSECCRREEAAEKSLTSSATPYNTPQTQYKTQPTLSTNAGSNSHELSTI